MNSINSNKYLILFSLFIFMLLFLQYNNNTIYANEIEQLADEIEKEQQSLNEIRSDLSNSQQILNEINNNINSLNSQVLNNNKQINGIEQDITDINNNILDVSDNIETFVKELEQKNDNKYSIINDINYQTLENSLIFFSDKQVSSMITSKQYALFYIDYLSEEISTNTLELDELKSTKQEYVMLKTEAEKLKINLKNRIAEINKDVQEKKMSQGSVLSEISNLETRQSQSINNLNKLSREQQRLVDLKTGDGQVFSSLNVPSAGDLAASSGYDPGFNNGFAVFSFGAPHRQGMSQYGAKGRAESGQDYKDILKAYYGDINIKTYNMPKNIRTDQGKMNFEERYLMGISEMHSHWPMEALRAQAIASRTFALVRGGWSTNSQQMKKEICTSEACQVWRSDKVTNDLAERWHKAVKETEGQIIVSKKTNDIFTTMYAATSGGYNFSYTSLGHTTSGGWDTDCQSMDCFTSGAYENIGESPWFYKAWYKTRSGESCSRSHPWLTNEEFADIIGALYLYDKDNDTQRHLSQIDALKCGNGNVDDAWSKQKVRDKSGIDTIKSIEVEYSSRGYTSTVKVDTNKGSFEFSGEDFKDIFNLRAPGMIHLKSLLFNIESN